MRLRRPSRKAVSATVAAAAVAVAVIATVSAKGGSARVVPQASTVAVEVLRPGQRPLRFATATAGRPAVGARAIAVPADGLALLRQPFLCIRHSVRNLLTISRHHGRTDLTLS